MIINYLRIGLIFFGAWPGVTTVKAFVGFLVITVLCLIFQVWNAMTVLYNLDELLKNLDTTIAVVATLFRFASFQIKQR